MEECYKRYQIEMRQLLSKKAMLQVSTKISGPYLHAMQSSADRFNVNIVRIFGAAGHG